MTWPFSLISGDLDAVGHAAVLLPDDDVLGDVHHAAGQVTGVCGTQSGIGQALTGATAGDEVLQSGQTLAVVCLDGDLDGADRRCLRSGRAYRPADGSAS